MKGNHSLYNFKTLEDIVTMCTLPYDAAPGGGTVGVNFDHSDSDFHSDSTYNCKTVQVYVPRHLCIHCKVQTQNKEVELKHPNVSKQVAGDLLQSPGTGKGVFLVLLFCSCQFCCFLFYVIHSGCKETENANTDLIYWTLSTECSSL